MSCILCERIDETTFYNFNETVTLHSMTPVRQFLEKLIGCPIRIEESNDVLFCTSCYDNFNEVDQMEVKIKKIATDMRTRYKKRQNIKEQIIISSMDRSEIYSVIKVDDDPDYFDYQDNTELHSPNSPKVTSELEKRDSNTKKQLSSSSSNNSEVKKESNNSNEKIHFTNQHDLKSILSMKIKTEEESDSWEDNIDSDHKVSVLYDMMDEKNVGIFLEPKSNSSSKEPHKCTRCNIIFFSKQELKSHNTTKHAEDKPYICEVCGKVYRHKSALTIHVGMHNGISPFKCLHCDKTFTQKGAMMRHNKIHTGEKPYQCEECGKCFTHHTSFTIHKISHTGEKSYKCNVCGLMLMSTSHLKRHMRVHTGEKRYSCSTCGKRFAEKYNLVSHSKLHTNEAVSTQKRKFRCDICNLVFYKRLHLEEHVTKNHSIADDNYDYC
ncbi:zinc finger protein 287-like [Coccinella septempunctata]|uniref:zinc finger protein 287-like n=1 Tax=Coccinella septempunctata TaxID=41139 RepID=UPI001D07DA65|nr:zinc finger protein 287-like [Coccinella septempunctata]